MFAPRRSQEPPRQTFASFTYGPESLLAYRACHAVAQSPGVLFNPLYVQGGPGLGKTHLLQAIARQLREQHDMHDVVVMPTAILAGEGGGHRRGAAAIRARSSAAEALLIDDLPGLAGYTAVLDDLATLIETLCAGGRQVVVSGTADPATLKGLSERLRACLAAGLVVRLGQPSLRTRLALARAFAAATSTWFTAEALHVLAYRTTGGIGELQTTVRRCARWAPAGTIVDAAHVKHVLGERQRSASQEAGGGALESILGAVCAEFGVARDALVSATRTAQIAQARQIAMYLLREDAGLTVTRIGRELGRDHSTVMHGCRRIETGLAETDGAIVAAIAAVREHLRDAMA